MLQDSQGLEVTTDSPIAIAAINCFIDRSLSYGKDAYPIIMQGLVADPDCAILHAYAAAHFLSQENAQAWNLAAPHLKAARKHLGGITERERLYVEAIAAWSKGEIQPAIELHEVMARKFPQDVLSVQQGQYHYFYLGDSERMLRIAETVLPANRDNHYLYGTIAFGLEQCDRLSEAEEIGRQALAIDRKDPWAQHAVAHVLETQGRVEEGIAWMESYADTWENCNSMLYTHNWWHVALYYLTRGDISTVLELYDAHIWGRARKESPKDQVGAISLLLRLELRGVDVGDRWQALVAHLWPRLYEHALPFQDLHYIYALARVGNSSWTTEMLLSMHDRAKQVHFHQRQTWAEVVIPAARGLVAHAKGDYLTAVKELQPVLPRLLTVGGSHTQRQLFEQIYRDALLRKRYVILGTFINRAFEESEILVKSS